MRGRGQPHFEAERQQLPPPMMGRRARFHRHHTPRKLGEKVDKPASCELARRDDLAIRIDGVNLKDPLRQIESNAIQTANVSEGRIAPLRRSPREGWGGRRPERHQRAKMVVVETPSEGSRPWASLFRN